MIAIIDYGVGNVFAFRNLYQRLNVPVSFARTPADLNNASKLILPGVGAFDRAMERLDDSGLRPAIEDAVIQNRKPVLGVCVGLQMLAESSEEGEKKGLGWIRGNVRKFTGETTALPHMGWNDVKAIKRGGLFQSMDGDARFYFLHSYYLDCHDKMDILAVADYEPR